MSFFWVKTKSNGSTFSHLRCLSFKQNETKVSMMTQDSSHKIGRAQKMMAHEPEQGSELTTSVVTKSGHLQTTDHFFNVVSIKSWDYDLIR